MRKIKKNRKIYESIDPIEIENQLKAVEKVLPNVIISSYKLPFTITFGSLPGDFSLRMEFKENPNNDDIRFDVTSMVPSEYSNGLCDDIDLYYIITDIYNQFADITGVVDKINIPTYSSVNENMSHPNRINKIRRNKFKIFENMKKRKVSVNESMSVTDYENKIKNLGNSDELKNILIHEYDLPTEKEVLTQLIKEWLDYQDYIDDPRGYDVALAYYYMTYGDDEVFQKAVKDAVQNMWDKGFVNESKNNKNKRKTFENFRKMKKNKKKVTYRVNENSQRKRFKRLPMFENYLEEKYDSVKLLDGHKYVLTGDVVAEGGQVLAKKGDTVTYEDVVGVFSNNAMEFTTDCGVFRTEDGQALCPEILMSQNLVSDPQSKMTEDPKAFMAEVVAECRKVGQKLGKAVAARKKIYESLTDEQKKKYQEKQAKLTDKQIEKYNNDITNLEIKAMKLADDADAGKITQEEMMKKTDRLTKSALEKYRIITGGEDPDWYEEYMDEPGFGKDSVSESGIVDNDYYDNLLMGNGDHQYTTILLSENMEDADELLKFCADNGFTLTKQQLEADKDIDIQLIIDEDEGYKLVDFRIYDPNNSISSLSKSSNNWSKWMKYKSINESDNNNYSTILLSENDEKVNDILKFCSDCGFELTKQQLEDNYVDVEVAVDAEGNFVDFRIYDPNSSVSSGYKYADGWTNWMLDTYEDVNESEVKDVVDDDILTPETVEAVLTADDNVKDKTVTAVVDAVKDDAKEGEEISLDNVVDATVDAELSKEEATTVINAVVDAVVDQKAEEKTVNESKKRSLKKAVKESLHKKFRKGVFEARVMKIKNKRK